MLRLWNIRPSMGTARDKEREYFCREESWSKLRPDADVIMVIIRKLDREMALKLKEEYYKIHPNHRPQSFRDSAVVNYVTKSLGFVGRTWSLKENLGEWMLIAGIAM